MFPNGKKVVDETHDEHERNVNHDFIDSNFGFKTHHIPKIDIRKFDGKGPVIWILQMDLCYRKNIVTWSIFTEEMIAHYEDTNSNTTFTQLINLKQ